MQRHRQASRNEERKQAQQRQQVNQKQTKRKQESRKRKRVGAALWLARFSVWLYFGGSRRRGCVIGVCLAGFNSGVAQWLACWAHNPKVRGSKPRSAMLWPARFACLSLALVCVIFVCFCDLFCYSACLCACLWDSVPRAERCVVVSFVCSIFAMCALFVCSAA